MSILKERNMRIYSWMEAVLGFILGLVALVAACGSFVVAVTAKEMVLGMVAGLVAVAGWVLGTYLVVVCGSEDSILAMLRKEWWQRWGTSSIRRRLVHLREKVGQRMAHMTMAHMGQVIARLSGEVNDFRTEVVKLRRMVAAMNRDNYKLWMQIRGLKRAKESCIKQARQWKALADLWQAACICQEEELKSLRPKHERRRTVMRAFYARGDKPEGMSIRLWSALNKLIKELPNDKFMELAHEIARVEERNRQSWRWKVLLSSSGTAIATEGEKAPGIVDGHTIEQVLKAFSIEDAYMIGSILAGEMVDSGMLAAQNAVVEGRAYQHAFMLTFPAKYAKRWHELSRLVNPRA